MANRLAIGIGVSFVLLAAIGMFAVKAWRGSGTDELEKERQLARQAGIPLEPKDLRHPIAAKDNAADAYRKLFTKIQLLGTRKSKLRKTCDSLLAGRPVSGEDTAELARGLRDMATELAAAEGASKRPYCDFEYHLEDGFNVEFPELVPSKDAIRLLCGRAHLERQSGSYGRALGTLASAARMSGHMGQSPLLIGMLIEISGEQLVFKEFNQLLRTAKNRREMLEAAGKWLKQLGPIANFKKACEGEVVMGRTGLLHLKTMGELKAASQGIGAVNTDSTPIPAYVKTGFEIRLLKGWRQVFPILNGTGTWLEKRERLASFEATVEADHSPLNAYNAIVMPLLDSTAGAVSGQLANRRLAECAQRLMLERLSKGSFPAKLPRYGDVSMDPYSDAPLHYQSFGNGFLLYSVGRDGKDNGGQLQKPGVPGDIVFRLD